MENPEYPTNQVEEVIQPPEIEIELPTVEATPEQDFIRLLQQALKEENQEEDPTSRIDRALKMIDQFLFAEDAPGEPEQL